MAEIFRHRTFQSFDETVIHLHIAGPDDAPTLVVVNEPGGSVEMWRPFATGLGDDARLVVWDTRGLYRSAAPRDESAVGVGAHCGDLLGVLDEIDLQDAVLLCWGLGFTIGLELWRTNPERVRALVGINASAGRDATATDPPNLPLSELARTLRNRWDWVRGAVDAVRMRPSLVRLARRLRLLGPVMNSTDFVRAAEAFADIDLDRYSRYIEELSKYDGEHVAESVRCPTLLVAGDRDRLVPPNATRRLHRLIRGSELLVIPVATHYIPLEFPEYLQLRLEQFFEDHGCQPARSGERR